MIYLFTEILYIIYSKSYCCDFVKLTFIKLNPGASDGGLQFNRDHKRIEVEKLIIHRTWRRGHWESGRPERATEPKAPAFIRPMGEMPAFPGLSLDWAIQTKNSMAWGLISEVTRGRKALDNGKTAYHESRHWTCLPAGVGASLRHLHTTWPHKMDLETAVFWSSLVKSLTVINNKIKN